MQLRSGHPHFIALVVLAALIALLALASTSEPVATAQLSPGAQPPAEGAGEDFVHVGCDEICLHAEQPSALLQAAAARAPMAVSRGPAAVHGAVDFPGKAPPHRPPIG